MAQRREFWVQQEKVIREVLTIEMGNGNKCQYSNGSQWVGEADLLEIIGTEK